MALSSRGPVAAIIVAAGRGVRAGGSVPKQYRKIGGRSVLAKAIQPFLDCPTVNTVTVVINGDDLDAYQHAVTSHPKLKAPVNGGHSRQESVRNGLESLVAEMPSRVLIHDGARPFLTAGLVEEVIAALDDAPGALPATPVSDTLKRANDDDIVAETIPRDGMFAAQTPQGFHYADILEAHRIYATEGTFTDDAAIAEAAGFAVRIVPGEAGNTKITSSHDIDEAENRLAEAMTTRTGTGYDVHALGDGDHVILGGISIPHDSALIGHSDADVVLHAITDAILGALADGDIGDHFPPSDPAFRGVSSDRFLADAVSRIARRGGTLDHIDTTIVAEGPKIGPHRDTMRARIAEICGIDLGSVSVKATTNERLGFLGRGEGIAAIATATLRLPKS